MLAMLAIYWDEQFAFDNCPKLLLWHTMAVRGWQSVPMKLLTRRASLCFHWWATYLSEQTEVLMTFHSSIKQRCANAFLNCDFIINLSFSEHPANDPPPFNTMEGQKTPPAIVSLFSDCVSIVFLLLFFFWNKIPHHRKLLVRKERNHMSYCK